MAKILVLAKSGFGKTTSIGNIPELGIEGLNPEETYLLSTTSKPLPFKGSKKAYPITQMTKNVESMKTGRRVVTSNPKQVEAALNFLIGSPFKSVVIDDFNYIMQDWYMENALATGWDGPKKIGYFMGKIFSAIEQLDLDGKDIYILAHGEEHKNDQDGRIYMKMKTTGNMVDSYLTPEGKFDVVVLGISRYDASDKKVEKNFLTNESEQYSSAKSPFGMFPDLLIPNDLGLVSKTVKEYYEG